MGALSGQPPTAERRLAGLRVGVYGSGGAPWHHLALASVHGADVRIVRAEDIKAGRLEELDALVFPGGGALAMAGLMAPLGETGATVVRDTERGVEFIGICSTRQVSDDTVAQAVFQAENLSNSQDSDELSKKYTAELRERAQIVQR